MLIGLIVYGEPGLLEEDRDLVPVGRRPVVEIDHRVLRRARQKRARIAARRRSRRSGRRCSRRARCTGTRTSRRTRRSCRSARPASRRAAACSVSSNDFALRPSRARSIVARRRSVSNDPGSRLLIVTLCAATLRASPATKPVQAGARAVRQPENVDRRLDRGGRDVDDAAELARDHRVDGRLDELDRRQHVRVDRAEPRGAVPVAEVAGRRSARVVDQDVGLAARGERGCAAFRRRDVAATRTRRAVPRARRSPPRCAAAGPRLRATIVTSHPASASACAQPRPRPLLAAQTSARRPAIPRSIVSSSGARARAWLVESRLSCTTVPIASSRHRGDRVEELVRERVVEHRSRTRSAPIVPPSVEPRVDESVDAPRGALGCRGLDDQVARTVR